MRRPPSASAASCRQPWIKRASACARALLVPPRERQIPANEAIAGDQLDPHDLSVRRDEAVERVTSPRQRTCCVAYSCRRGVETGQFQPSAHLLEERES